MGKLIIVLIFLLTAVPTNFNTVCLLFYSGKTISNRTKKQRRNDQNLHMATLSTLLPFHEDSTMMKDKVSVLRLTGAYLKLQKFLQDGTYALKGL